MTSTQDPPSFDVSGIEPGASEQALPWQPSGKLLSAAQLRDLDERGFCFTDVLFDEATIEPVRLACRRIWQQADSALPGDVGPHDPRRLRPFLPRAFEKSDEVARFTRHPTFCQLAGELIGPDVDQTWSQACLKLPDPGDVTTFPFHQDSRFAEVTEHTSAISCFLALAPLSIENGTLCFAAGAHRMVLPHSRNDRLGWFECSVAEFEVAEGVLRPGQLVIYRNTTPHGSPPNRSSSPREALLVTFNVPGTRLVETGELFGDQRPLLRGGRLA
jgi:hypothetical protein